MLFLNKNDLSAVKIFVWVEKCYVTAVWVLNLDIFLKLFVWWDLHLVIYQMVLFVAMTHVQ